MSNLLFMIATEDVENETCLNNTIMCMGPKGMSKKWAVKKPTQVVLNQIGNVYKMNTTLFPSVTKFDHLGHVQKMILDCNTSCFIQNKACLKNEHYFTSFSALIWYHRACPKCYPWLQQKMFAIRYGMPKKWTLYYFLLCPNLIS